MNKISYLFLFILFFNGCVAKEKEKQQSSSKEGSCDIKPKNKQDVFVDIDGKKTLVLILSNNDCYISLEKTNNVTEVVVVLTGKVGVDKVLMKIVLVLKKNKKIVFSNPFNVEHFNLEVMIHDHSLKKVKDIDVERDKIKI